VRAHAAVYAGRVVAPAEAGLQNEGSMIMGLGSALFEAIELEGGQVSNANLSDYQLPAFLDVAPISHTLLEREGAEIHGLGETALPLMPAAVGNALASLGVRLTRLPVHAEQVLDALDARDGTQRADRA
jgi:CO/xanthine dehydrogenase Mo-binding subunit